MEGDNFMEKTCFCQWLPALGRDISEDLGMAPGEGRGFQRPSPHLEAGKPNWVPCIFLFCVITR